MQRAAIRVGRLEQAVHEIIEAQQLLALGVHADDAEIKPMLRLEHTVLARHLEQRWGPEGNANAKECQHWLLVLQLAVASFGGASLELLLGCAIVGRLVVVCRVGQVMLILLAVQDLDASSDVEPLCCSRTIRVIVFIVWCGRSQW